MIYAIFAWIKSKLSLLFKKQTGESAIPDQIAEKLNKDEMKLKTIFNHVGVFVKSLFTAHSPAAEQATEALIKGLEIAKGIVDSPPADIVAHLFPSGIGCTCLDSLKLIINDVLPGLEMAQGVEQAIQGIDDPYEKAHVALAFIVKNINSLPPDYRGKHWLDVATRLLAKVLNISITEANTLINAKLGDMKANP